MILRATVLRSAPIRAARGVVTGHQVAMTAGPLHITALFAGLEAPPDGAEIDVELTESNGAVSAVAGWTRA